MKNWRIVENKIKELWTTNGNNKKVERLWKKSRKKYCRLYLSHAPAIFVWQDTIVALQAMTEFVKHYAPSGYDMHVLVRTEQSPFHFEVNMNNSQVLQSHGVSDKTNMVSQRLL